MTGQVASTTASARRRGAARKKTRLSPNWRKVFAVALAETSNVSRSCETAGVSASTVYALRRKNPEFARRWMIALCEGYDHLEMDLLSRLRSGEARDDGRKYEYGTAFRLLAAHRESAARERAMRDNEDADAILASIDAKLDAMRERAQAISDETGDCGADNDDVSA